MKTTALHAVHEAAGAKLVDFAGWHMPVQYGPILDEVRQVRNSCGLFDLAHMGRISVRGAQAVEFVDHIATNYCARIPLGSIRYSLICNEHGGPLDDVLIYRESDGSVFIVVNASNTDTVLAWMNSHVGEFDATIEDRTEELGMVALQGPRSAEILARVVSGCDVQALGYYKFDFGTVCGLENARISRTGYTGEDGFELYFPRAESEHVWKTLLAETPEGHLMPIGLGARDTLRLEAGMALYGHEIDLEHNPIEAGLKFAVSFHPDKANTIGRAALEEIYGAPKRRLMGITTPGPRVPREGYAIFHDDEEVGVVCSGSVSPTLETNIGSVYINKGHDRPDLELSMDVRGKRQSCTLQELPFYSRTRK